MRVFQYFGLIALIFAMPQQSLARSIDVLALDATRAPALIVLARKGADDGADHDRGDDRGGARSDRRHDKDDHGHHRRGRDDSKRPDRQDNNDGRRPRVPGGSGCDSAQDVAEHAVCQG